MVVEAGGDDYALAGGNVCAVAQRNGIAGFVLDGAVRDVAEIRALQFPVFCRGVFPKPGSKDFVGSLGAAVTCGGVRVACGDVVVADEEGIVVVPHGERVRMAHVLVECRQRQPPQVAWATFSLLTFDAAGVLNAAAYLHQQSARAESALAPGLSASMWRSVIR